MKHWMGRKRATENDRILYFHRRAMANRGKTSRISQRKSFLTSRSKARRTRTLKSSGKLPKSTRASLQNMLVRKAGVKGQNALATRIAALETLPEV